MKRAPRWRRLVTSRPFLVELFVGVNLAFLALDIWVAHSVNAFAHPAEWIPLGFTILAALAVLVNLAVSAAGGFRAEDLRAGSGRWVGIAVGAGGIAVGVAGLLYHLRSAFFEVMTLRSLVYSAPFVAPLAFTGLGLLVVMTRLVPERSVEWGQWVLLLAWGGFLGNFVLSLVDHAQNGFFYATEWIPVVIAGMTAGWLLIPIFLRTPPAYLRIAFGVLGVAAITGVAGFALHLSPAVTEQGGTFRDRVVYGAPVFAPLLFPNLALLAGLGVWDLLDKGWVAERAEGRTTTRGRPWPL